QPDYLVEVVERDQQALEDVGAGLGLAQLELGAADDDLALVGDVVADQVLEVQDHRYVVDQGDHVQAERGLQGSVLVELVENNLCRIAAALELDDEPHSRAVG